jgi:hypothetical protein
MGKHNESRSFEAHLKSLTHVRGQFREAKIECGNLAWSDGTLLEALEQASFSHGDLEQRQLI